MVAEIKRIVKDSEILKYATKIGIQNNQCARLS